MTRLETRYPCPVCLGVKMEKVRLRTEAPEGARTAHTPDELALDHCPRCGGVWFEAGEVQQLRRTDATALWREIVQRDGVHAMQCHECRSMFPRSAAHCPACGWKVVLDCPMCGRAMRIAEQAALRLDYCPRDRAVWFDHDELTGIWKMEVDALVKRRGSRALDAAGDVLLLDVLLFDPFVMYYGVSAAAHAAGAAAEAMAASGSVEVIGEVAGAAGEVATSLFETIVEIIGGIFG
ncbi:MAG TPA: zf-TFIIB domain-containing protein [Longimicrobiales bacterium]